MSWFRPDEYLVSVLDIEPQRLLKQGFHVVLLDIDNTIMPRTVDYVPQNIADWVDSLKEAGLTVVLLSNSTKDRAPKAAAQLDVQLVAQAYKPLPGGFRRCCELLDTHADDFVMVGDQTYTDILGANLFGIHTIMVEPLCEEVDLFHTRLLRRFDKMVLAGLHPVGGAPAYTREEGE